jgi:hypothetical protein
MLEPITQSAALLIGAVGNPGPVAKHQNIRAGSEIAADTARERVACLKGFFININFDMTGIPDGVVTWTATLKMVDRTVTLFDLITIKSSFLEVSIYIGGKDKIDTTF